MASLFGKVADEIIDAHDQVYTQIVKGASILLGKDGESAGAGAPRSDGPLGALDEDVPIEDMEDMRSPLEGIADSVMGDIMQGQFGPQTPMEHFDAFRSAINWSEPFVRCLLAFHILVFVATIFVCKYESAAFRISLLMFIAILVKSSEFLNSYGARNWQDFATQNYFDERGIFVGIMLCVPLLLDAFIMLISFIREASKLLVQVKKMEIEKKRRKQEKASERVGKKMSKTPDKGGKKGGGGKKTAKED